MKSHQIPGQDGLRIGPTDGATNLPPVTAPRISLHGARDGGPETTPAGGNHFPVSSVGTDELSGTGGLPPRAGRDLPAAFPRGRWT